MGLQANGSGGSTGTHLQQERALAHPWVPTNQDHGAWHHPSPEDTRQLCARWTRQLQTPLVAIATSPDLSQALWPCSSQQALSAGPPMSEAAACSSQQLKSELCQAVSPAAAGTLLDPELWPVFSVSQPAGKLKPELCCCSREQAAPASAFEGWGCAAGSR